MNGIGDPVLDADAWSRSLGKKSQGPGSGRRARHVNEEMLNIRDQPTVFRVGYNDGLEEELAVIEAKAHHLREEVAKGMAKASRHGRSGGGDQ